MRIVLALLFFLLPLVWSRYVNANYLTAKTFLLYFSSALAILALPARINLRKIPRSLLILLGLIFVYYTVFHLWSLNYLHVLLVFKMLSFVFLTLYFYSLNLKIDTLFRRLSYPFFFMWLIILAVTCYEVFDLRVLHDNVKTDIILSTFGNINMFSEFAVLSIPLLVFWGRDHQVSRWPIPVWVKNTFLFFVAFLVLYGRSRSAWLGLILWFGFKAWQGLRKGEYVALALALVLFSISHFTAPDTETISKFVPTAFSERGSLYKASLELLWNRPFGIEPGQFVNEIVPYLLDKPNGPNEFAYFDQPHSEFLKWGIQFGWLMLGFSLAVMALIFRELVRKCRSADTKARPEGSLLLETFLILLPEMCFQFPFENPATLLLLSFVFGLFLSSYPRGISLRIRWFQPLLGVLAVAGIVNAFLFLSAISLESMFPASPDLMDVACDVYPANFRTCYWKNKDLLEQRNVEAFRTQFKEDYQVNPFFCDNLRLLPEYFNRQKKEKKTCEALLLYNVIYRNQRHFTADTMQLCRAYPLPFKYENAEQFNRDFRRWFLD